MTARTFTRASFIASLAGAGLVLAAPAAHAARNADAEAFAQSSATQALNAISQPQGREQTFQTLMSQFADVPRIANFVLGRYAVQLRNDPALRSAWVDVFRDYAFAVYMAQLDRYRGAQISVTNSIERIPGQDVVVRTEMAPRGQSRPLPVQWRLLKNGDSWKVVDVSLILDGNEIWLAQQQQRDFLAMLDANHGDIQALMAHVRSSTANLRQRSARG
ncbi:MAG TPA: ABC transporter substrate-binding protein [Caulobacterales bacterium]|nr:ABC transporter substrate-binding protein [Caulobacterales bacterium]